MRRVTPIRRAGRMRPAALLAVAALLALSGCTAPTQGPEGFGDGELGSVGGYAADDDLAFDASDGLDADELEALKYRTMARIELLRGLEFTEDVDLEVIDRETYREQRTRNGGSVDRFENEVWRGAFVVDGETDVDRAFDELYGGAVAGYYADGRIVVVTDDADDVRLDRTTLVHELVHALQHQRFGLERRGTTIDERRAENGVIEGEASFVPHRYDDRCGEEWSCVPDPGSGGGGGLEGRPFNAGLFLSVYVPYAEGPRFVAHQFERGGWDAVDELHAERPRSTAQLIHPDLYPEREPATVTVTDRSDGAWTPILDDDGDRRTETIGEATLFASLWVNGVVERPLTDGATALSPYNYTHAASAGWAGDAFVGYRDASADETRTGHVWKLVWASPADAAEFRDAYATLLENRGAERLAGGDAGGEADGGETVTYRIPDGERFAGAYRVALEGDRVVIVGAPTPDDLAGIRSPGDASGGATESLPSPRLTPSIEGPAVRSADPVGIGTVAGDE